MPPYLLSTVSARAGLSVASDIHVLGDDQKQHALVTSRTKSALGLLKFIFNLTKIFKESKFSLKD